MASCFVRYGLENKAMMHLQPKYNFKRLLPLFLILTTVLTVLVFLTVRHNNDHVLQVALQNHLDNATAQKAVAELIVLDLTRISDLASKAIINKRIEKQSHYLEAIALTITEINAALDVLTDGGSLSRALGLNIPGENQTALDITFTLENRRNSNAEVRSLRSMLVDLEALVGEILQATAERNLLLQHRSTKAIQDVVPKVDNIAKKIESLIQRMTNNANSLVFAAVVELNSLNSSIKNMRDNAQRFDLLWTGFTAIGATLLIIVIYRRILIGQGKLDAAVNQLQQTEYDLQRVNTEIQTLNESLEEQVKVRTQELQIAEKQWGEAFDAISSPIFLHDSEGKLLKVNKAYLDLGETTITAALGQPYWNIFPPHNGPLPEPVSVSTDKNSAEDLREINITISERVYRIRFFAVTDEYDKHNYTMRLVDDITEQQKYIEQLKKYKQIISTDKNLLAFINRDHTYLTVNDLYAEFFKVEPITIAGRSVRDVVGAAIYDDIVKEKFDLCLTGREICFKSWLDFPGIGLRYMEISFAPYREKSGEITGLVSRSEDITEKAEKEARLRLAAKVFENTTDGITITDATGSIIAINSAFTKITGYSEQEACGKNPRILKSDRHDDAYYQRLWQQLITQGQWQGEIWNRRKDGTVYPEWLTISAVKDENGKIGNFVAVFSDITEIKKATELLVFQAHHHPLTKLPNRLLLHARLNHSVQRAKRDGHQGAVLYLDLDNFKNINDSLGYSAGDEVLLEVARRLTEDSRDIDTVAHLSGDEFIVILEQIRSVADAVQVAEQILDKLQQPFNVLGYELFLSASLGISIFPLDSDSIEGLLKNADVAMTQAKGFGKNQYHIFSPELTEAAMERVILEGNLHHALDNEELVLYFQPQISLADEKIVACEALVRWQHPEYGLIPPDKFIPLSEETGLIVPMGEWILRKACEQFVSWQTQGYELQKMAVNLSGRQIQHKKLLEMVARVLAETGCPARNLELEITEGFIMQQPEESIAVLRQLRDIGIDLSVDDFGTGHSSLNYLKRLPINRLKIDRSFVMDILENSDDEAIVKAIIAMGRSLNLQVTAEGIETREQLSFLAALGCNEGQGFLISKPVPAHLFEELLKGA